MRLVTVTRQYSNYMGTTTTLLWVKQEVSDQNIVSRLKASDVRLYGQEAESYVIS